MESREMNEGIKENCRKCENSLNGYSKRWLQVNLKVEYIKQSI